MRPVTFSKDEKIILNSCLDICLEADCDAIRDGMAVYDGRFSVTALKRIHKSIRKKLQNSSNSRQVVVELTVFDLNLLRDGCISTALWNKALNLKPPNKGKKNAISSRKN